MKEKNMIKEQLTNKLVKLNQRIAELEKSVVECQQVEESLRESEEKFRILVEMATDAIFLETVEGRILECNTAGARMFGYTKKYMIGLTIADLVPEEFAKILPKVITEKETTYGIFVPRINKKKDGTLFPTEIATKIVNISEKPRLIVYIRDITERKKAKIALAESEEKFRITLKNSPIVVWNQDKDLRYTWIYNPNPGFKPEETIGKTDKELLPADDAEKLMHIKRKVLESGIGAREETKTTIQGNDYYYDLTVEPLRDSSNAIIGITCVATDITTRKKTEQELKVSEERYRTVFENTGTATVILEENRVISLANGEFIRLSGYSKEEIENKMKWTKFVVPEDLERMKKYHLARRKTGENPPSEYEFHLIDKKGTIKDIFLKIGMIPNTNKSIASLMDVTEWKRAEEKLLENKEQLTQIVNGSAVATFVIDNDHKITHWNRACEKLTSLSEEEMCGTNKQWKAFYAKERPTMSDIILDKLPEKRIKKYYYNKFRKSSLMNNAYEAEDFFPNLGEKGKWLSFAAAPIKDHRGNIISAIETLQDFTEKKESAEKIKKAMNATIYTMSKIIETKDPYTSGHQYRVSQLATRIAQEMKLSQNIIEGIRITSLIHDIGNLGIPTEILSKTTTLSEIEFSLIKDHSRIGFDILKSVEFPYPIAQIVLQHHERLDGSGYPNNLKGDDILLEARIIGVADVVEAMSSHRPYRPALGIDAALEEISKSKGILYDPEVVDVCLELFKEKGFKFE